MKIFHSNEKIDFSKKDPPGTCLMISTKTNRTCGAKLPYRSIYQHLETHHKVKRPLDKILFGFDLSSTSSPRPVFVSKGEELEPRDEEQDLAIESSESSQELEEEENSPEQIEQKEDIPIEEQPGDWEEPVESQDILNLQNDGEILNDIQESQILKEIYESEILNDNQRCEIPTESQEGEIPNEILTLGNSQKRQLMEALEDNEPNDLDGSYLLGVEDPFLNQGIREDENDDDDAIKFEEMPSETQTRNPRGEKRKRSRSLDLTNPFDNMHDVEDEINLSQPLLESMEEDDAIHGGQDDKDHVSDVSSDEDSHNAPLNITFDERYFSDFEEGDDVHYTEVRRKNKAIRHAKRNTDVIALQDQEQNSRFIADFTSYMKENIICSRSNQPTTLSKALRHLFHQEDSLLAYQTEQDKNFHLDDYRNITSATFRHLPFPADWIVSTAGKDGNKGGLQKKK